MEMHVFYVIVCLSQSASGVVLGLAQGPVRDGGTSTHWSFPTGSSLPPPYRAPGLGYLSTRPRRRRDGRASGVPLSGPRSRQARPCLARRHLNNRPAMPLELPGTDWGGDPPPTGNEREREWCCASVQCWWWAIITVCCVFLGLNETVSGGEIGSCAESFW